jgi:hypothetical protein
LLSALQSLISLKSDLLDLVYGTARGVSASGEQRAAIEEHITALEARNPNPRPTEVSQGAGRVVLIGYLEPTMSVTARFGCCSTAAGSGGWGACLPVAGAAHHRRVTSSCTCEAPFALKTHLFCLLDVFVPAASFVYLMILSTCLL